VAEAYRRHPFHAIRSEMAGRLLAGDAPALAAIQAARPPAGAPGVCTIGYEGSSLEGYLNRLLHAGVTLLCDVRRNPLSRKYGFSKSTLAKSTRDTRPETFHPVDVLDITHLGHLGTDDGWRERRQIILKQGKVHDRLGPLIDAAHANQCSLAVFKPAKILDFSWAPDDRDRDEVKVQEMRNRTDQGELFVGDADSEAFGAT